MSLYILLQQHHQSTFVPGNYLDVVMVKRRSPRSCSTVQPSCPSRDCGGRLCILPGHSFTVSFVIQTCIMISSYEVQKQTLKEMQENASLLVVSLSENKSKIKNKMFRIMHSNWTIPYIPAVFGMYVCGTMSWKPWIMSGTIDVARYI